MSKVEEFLIKRGNNEYEVVIGLEVHAQVTSKSKLFSSSSQFCQYLSNRNEKLTDVFRGIKIHDTGGFFQ